MTKASQKSIRYSISFKQMVVKEVECGKSIGETARKYGITGGATIQNWIKAFGKTHLLNQVIRIETMNEKDRVKDLESQVKELKIALADSLLAQRCLESLVSVADKEYKTDLKKSFGMNALKVNDKSKA